MAIYYLIVAQWIDGQLNPREQYHLIRQISGAQKYAHEQGQKYENTLNGTTSHLEVFLRIARAGNGYTVRAISYSRAQKYLSFPDWENCEQYS